jgi:hypothetical protein
MRSSEDPVAKVQSAAVKVEKLSTLLEAVAAAYPSLPGLTEAMDALRECRALVEAAPSTLKALEERRDSFRVRAAGRLGQKMAAAIERLQRTIPKIHCDAAFAAQTR